MVPKVVPNEFDMVPKVVPKVLRLVPKVVLKHHFWHHFWHCTQPQLRLTLLEMDTLLQDMGAGERHLPSNVVTFVGGNQHIPYCICIVILDVKGVDHV